jgi:hypothetical protein
MKVNIMPCRFPLSDNEWPKQLAAGVAVHGDESHISQKVDDSDVHAFWGLHRRWGKQALAQGKPSLIVERAYLGDRFHWRAMGWNSINGMANFCNDDVPDDRWRQYWVDSVKPWRSGGDYALVIGQVPHDASLRGANVYEWAANACRDALEVYGRVIFRPHPLDKHKRKIKGAEYHTGDLAEAFAGAACVVTYCSNTAVESVMAGIPTVAYDAMSMAYSVTSRSVKDALITPDRNDWGRKLAYCQWLPEEIESGAAWAHLRRYVYGSK